MGCYSSNSKMEENIAGENQVNNGMPFYIEAAISEGGPRKLRVVPSGEEYNIFDEEKHMASVQPKDGGWAVAKGELSESVANVIGKAISRYYS